MRVDITALSQVASKTLAIVGLVAGPQRAGPGGEGRTRPPPPQGSGTTAKNSNPELDLSFLDAFRQADKHFTANNEPQALRDCVDDMSFMQDDLSRWVHVAVDYQMSTSTSQADLDATAETVRHDLMEAPR
jgi:hypothetical protein